MGLLGSKYLVKAGKTFLSNELIKRFGFTYVSVDDELDKNDIEKMSQEDWNDVYTRAYDKLKKNLSEGKTVIFDGASLKHSERKTQRNIAEWLKVPHKLIYVNTTVEQIKER